MTYTVYWEDDPTRAREVTGICTTCQRIMIKDYDIMLKRESVMIVSPTGLGHAQGNYPNDDHTLCGKDARGEEWWWRL